MIDRRRFLSLAPLAAGAVLLPASGVLARGRAGPRVRTAAAGPVDDALGAALEKSGFVYVSPLKKDGAESTCHGEVWYGWLDGAVVLITAKTTWKARAVSKGLDRARVWVGDHGRWKGLVSRNEAFREAPSFVARAEVVKHDALLDRLLSLYDEKYPEEIGAWRDKMRSGYADGSRVLIRYAPAAAEKA